VKANGTEIVIDFKGLKGGHSGVEIDSGRVNSNVLAARVLNHLKLNCNYSLISIKGGDKSNAITNRTTVRLLTDNPMLFKDTAIEYLNVVKAEISSREPNFSPKITINETKECEVLSEECAKNLVNSLLIAPNGIIEMSQEIKGLVETSLNLGIVETNENHAKLRYALRSNKLSALDALEERVTAFYKMVNAKVEVSGHYPPWEYRENSKLQKLYCDTYFNEFGTTVSVEAIHAGLECGIFSSKIKGLDCIAIGPTLYDVHTVNEKLSISSLTKFFALLLKVLEKIR
jgi:dipeptidase D